MLQLADALDQIRARATLLSAEDIPLSDALGRAVADDVIADADLPSFDNSAVDGFAVHSADLAGCCPEVPAALGCTGQVLAGEAHCQPLPVGHAVRIMTGAPVPPGADAVVPCELCARDDSGHVLFMGPVEAGANRRPRGSDLRSGSAVLPAGHVLRVPDVMLLAALGRATVAVRRRPRTLLLTTGDELIPHDQPLTPGKVRDCNRVGLPLALAQAGAEVVRCGQVGDSAEQLEAALADRGDLDLILTVGGVSMGDADHVRPVFERLGRREFWRVAVKPGKPLLFGTLDGSLFFGLPGNPVSALVTLDLFVRPAIDALLGRSGGRRTVEGVWAEAVASDERRAEYVRVVAEQRPDGVWLARPTGQQSSGRLTSMLGANAYGVIPVGVAAVAVGEPARIELFEPGVLA